MKSKLFFVISTFLLVSTLFLPNSFAQDYTTWGLPEGAKARLGKGWQNDIAYSPDGKHIAIASSFGVWIYDSQTGEERNLLTTTTGSNHLWRIAFSPYGETLACAVWDGGTIHLWDIATQTHLHTLSGETGRIGHLTFSPDGRILASTTAGREGGTTTLWDVRTGTEKNKLIGPGNEHFSVVFNPDGQTLTSAGPAGVRLWNIETGTIQQTLSDIDLKNPLAFSLDGQTLVVTESTRRSIFATFWDIGVWDIATMTQTRSLRYGTDYPISFAFSPDGQTLASSREDGTTIELWNVATETAIHSLSGHINEVYMLAFSPDGQTLASGSEDRTIRLWDVATGTEKMVFTNNMGFRTPTFSPDGRTLALGTHDSTDQWNTKTIATETLDGTLHLWDVATGTEIRTLKGHTNDGYSLAFSPDGQTLASSGEDDSLSLWDVTSGTLISKLEKQKFKGIAFSPNGELLISTIEDSGHDISLYEVATGNLRYSIDLPSQHYAVDLKFTSDDTFTAVFLGNRFFSWNAHVYSWDVATANAKRLNKDLINSVNPPFARSSDGLTLAAKNGPVNVEWIGVWHIPTGEQLHELHGHTKPPSSLAFSPDGQTLASGSQDSTIRLWDVATGTEMYILSEHTGNVHGLAFSPDGQTLASTSADTTVLLWDMQNFPRRIPKRSDINNDGTVNIQDLVIIASAMGAATNGDIDTLLDLAASIAYFVGDVTREINELKKPFDLNNDGKINILDLVIVASELHGGDAAAPSIRSHQASGDLTAAEVQQWVIQARQLDLKNPTMHRGIQVLQHILEVLKVEVPQNTALLPNYPNPFNPETWIPYQLATPADVTLTIYDIQGRVVRDLDLGHQHPGMYQSKSRAAYWDGRNAVGEPVASGVYFYTLTAGKFTATRKMLIAK